MFPTRVKTSLIENVRILYIDQFDQFRVTRVKGGQSFFDLVVSELVWFDKMNLRHNNEF